MAGFRIEGNTSGNVAEVDANNRVKVVNPTTLGQEGFVALAGINDDGTVVSGGRHNRVYVAEGGSLYSGMKNLLWDDTFNASAQNTSKYKYANTTMAAAQSGGFLTLNSASITTASTSVGFQSWKSFPLFAKAELRINVSAQIPNGTQANQTIEFGLFNATLNGAAPGAPTDGVFFRFNTAGELRGYINYAGTETSTAVISGISTSVVHDWAIVIQTNAVMFYIDDILYGKLILTSDAPTLGQPMMAASMPITFRVFNPVSTPALAPILKITDVFISELGPDLNRPWQHQKAGFGHMGYQGQNGGTMGSTSNFGNGALAAATILSNTNVGTGNPVGLGGYSHNLATLAAGTDGIVTSFANPAGSTTQTPRNLVITGVRVASIVDSTLTGGPLVFLYTLAYGHSAVSLATSESGSFASGTTKAPRRIPLGTEGCAAAAAAGTLLSPAGFQVTFNSPVVVAPGEFVAVVARNVGTVASAGSVIHLVGFDAYFE